MILLPFFLCECVEVETTFEQQNNPSRLGKGVTPQCSLSLSLSLFPFLLLSPGHLVLRVVPSPSSTSVSSVPASCVRVRAAWLVGFPLTLFCVFSSQDLQVFCVLRRYSIVRLVVKVLLVLSREKACFHHCFHHCFHQRFFRRSISLSRIVKQSNLNFVYASAATWRAALMIRSLSPFFSSREEIDLSGSKRSFRILSAIDLRLAFISIRLNASCMIIWGLSVHWSSA